MACINALQHVSTEQLETGELLHLAQQAANLQRQRDELLSALEAMTAKATKQNWNDLYPEILEQAFAAIGKARGEA